jgi:hypothetical protein
LAVVPQESRAGFSYSTYTFGNITTNSPTDSSSGGQYSITVWGGDSGTLKGSTTGLGTGVDVQLTTSQVLIVFKNTASPVAGSVTDVYFQDGTLLGIASIHESSGLDFSSPANPGDLPAGNTITPAFKTTEQWSADSTKPATGVDDSSDALGVLFNLKSGYGYSDVVNALANGISEPGNVWNADGTDKTGGDLGLRVGIHVTAFTDGKSESFIDSAKTGSGDDGGGGAGSLADPAPAPPSAVLLGLGTLGFVGAWVWSRRRRVAFSA